MPVHSSSQPEPEAELASEVPILLAVTTLLLLRSMAHRDHDGVRVGAPGGGGRDSAAADRLSRGLPPLAVPDAGS